MASRPVIHIHAGLPKTGTSAIQRFLAENKRLLAAKGLIVPEAWLGERGDHHAWMHAIGGLSGGARRHAVSELTDWMVEQPSSTFLLSSEFAYLMLRFGFAGRGYRALRRRGFAVKFHLFVRPQTDFAVSGYPEFLRNLMVPQPFPTFVETNFLPFASDYGDIAQRLEKVSGERVAVLPYNSRARGEGVWWSLLRSADLDMPAHERCEFAVPGEVNPSLGPIGVAALQNALKRMDRRRLASRWGLRLALRKTVLHVTGNFPVEKARFNPLTKTQRRALWERCSNVNDRFALDQWDMPWDEVFPDEAAHLPPFQIYRRFEDDPESAAARQHDRMVNRLMRRVRETRADVAAARRELNIVRWIGSPLDRLADRAMRRIVRGR